MILRLTSLIRKEFIQIGRDPRTLFLTLLYPVVMLFMLGYAITNDVRNISLAVLDHDKSSQSRALLDAYRAADYFRLEYFIDSEDEMRNLIESNKARAAIIIPPNYGRELVAGRQAQVAFIIDGSDPNVAGTALSAAVLVGQSQSSRVMVERYARSGRSSPATQLPVDVRTTSLVQPRHGHCLLHDPRAGGHDPAVPHHLPHLHLDRARARARDNRTAHRHPHSRLGAGGGQAAPLCIDRLFRYGRDPGCGCAPVSVYRSTAA